MIAKSLLRIKFTPTTGSTIMVVDWMQKVQELTLPPWVQVVQTDQVVDARFAGIIPRGNVTRAWVMVAREEFATATAMHEDSLDMDATLPANVPGTLDVRLLDLDAPETGTESERTLAQWTASEATIESRVPRPVPEMLAVDATWTLRLNELVKQT